MFNTLLVGLGWLPPILYHPISIFLSILALLLVVKLATAVIDIVCSVLGIFL